MLSSVARSEIVLTENGLHCTTVRKEYGVLNDVCQNTCMHVCIRSTVLVDS